VLYPAQAILRAGKVTVFTPNGEQSFAPLRNHVHELTGLQGREFLLQVLQFCRRKQMQNSKLMSQLESWSTALGATFVELLRQAAALNARTDLLSERATNLTFSEGNAGGYGGAVRCHPPDKRSVFVR
jgi:hypothetical protein